MLIILLYIDIKIGIRKYNIIFYHLFDVKQIIVFCHNLRWMLKIENE